MSEPPYHTFAHTDYTSAADRGLGLLVPQQVYQAKTYYSPLPPIHFSCGGVAGVRVVDAEPGVIRNLDNRTFRPLINPAGSRIALRIFWPGYHEWTCHNVTIKHHTTQADGFTMEELAGAVASRIREFYADMRNETCMEPAWGLPVRPFESLYLLELRHVSQSSWQPVLKVCL